MSDSDSEYESIPKKRKIKEISIPNGLVNGPVKHKKIKTPYAAKELFPLHTLCAFIGLLKYHLGVERHTDSVVGASVGG